jgi:hypothetical protein
MSAIEVDEYISVKRNDNHTEVLAERAKILRTVSRKAQDKTLTLEETNDLFAKFNETYQARSAVKKKPVTKTFTDTSVHGVDESWAIKLMRECEQEDSSSLKTSKHLNTDPFLVS